MFATAWPACAAGLSASGQTTNLESERDEEGQHKERGDAKAPTSDLQFLERRIAGLLGTPGRRDDRQRPSP